MHIFALLEGVSFPMSAQFLRLGNRRGLKRTLLGVVVLKGVDGSAKLIRYIPTVSRILTPPPPQDRLATLGVKLRERGRGLVIARAEFQSDDVTSF